MHLRGCSADHHFGISDTDTDRISDDAIVKLSKTRQHNVTVCYVDHIRAHVVMNTLIGFIHSTVMTWMHMTDPPGGEGESQMTAGGGKS